MNLVAVTQFFEAIYTDIFIRSFIAKSIKGSLGRSISTYFGTVETNGQAILQLYNIV